MLLATWRSCAGEQLSFGARREQKGEKDWTRPRGPFQPETGNTAWCGTWLAWVAG